MDQKGLIDAAKTQQGLTSDYALAQRLGIRRSRMSLLNSGALPADEAEIFMLAEMAGIDPRAAAAAVKKNREKNPAKRAYWEKISLQFALGMLLVTLCFTWNIQDSYAAPAQLTFDKLFEFFCLEEKL